VGEVLVMKASTEASHVSASRRRPTDIEANLKVNKKLLAPVPKSIFVFDDVLTTGAHFVAAREVLKEQFPEAKITGIFIARTIRPLDAAADFADFKIE
jgi:predicted amidophosphoribosyltransferase